MTHDVFAYKRDPQTERQTHRAHNRKLSHYLSAPMGRWFYRNTCHGVMVVHITTYNYVYTGSLTYILVLHIPLHYHYRVPVSPGRTITTTLLTILLPPSLAAGLVLCAADAQQDFVNRGDSLKTLYARRAWSTNWAHGGARQYSSHTILSSPGLDSGIMPGQTWFLPPLTDNPRYRSPLFRPWSAHVSALLVTLLQRCARHY